MQSIEAGGVTDSPDEIEYLCESCSATFDFAALLCHECDIQTIDQSHQDVPSSEKNEGDEHEEFLSPKAEDYGMLHSSTISPEDCKLIGLNLQFLVKATYMTDEADAHCSANDTCICQDDDDDDDDDDDEDEDVDDDGESSSSGGIEEIDDEEIARLETAEAKRRAFHTKPTTKIKPCPGCDFITQKSDENICLRCGYELENVDEGLNFNDDEIDVDVDVDDDQMVKLTKTKVKSSQLKRKKSRKSKTCIKERKMIDSLLTVSSSSQKQRLSPLMAPCQCPDISFRSRKEDQGQQGDKTCGCPSLKDGEIMCKYCNTILRSLPDRLRDYFGQFKSIYFKNSDGQIYEGFIVAPVLKVSPATVRVRYFLKQWRAERYDEQIELIDIYMDFVSGAQALGNRRRRVSCRLFDGADRKHIEKIIIPEDLADKVAIDRKSSVSCSCGCPDISFRSRKEDQGQQGDKTCGCPSLKDGEIMCKYCNTILRSLPDRLRDYFGQFKSIYFKNHVGEIHEGIIITPVLRGNPETVRVRYYVSKWRNEKWDEQIDLNNIYLDFVSGADLLGSRRRTVSSRLRDHDLD
jgi:hypothetical protein